MESKAEFRKKVNKLLRTGLESDRNIVKAWLLGRYPELFDEVACGLLREKIDANVYCKIHETTIEEYYKEMYGENPPLKEIHINLSDRDVESCIDFIFTYKGKFRGYNDFIFVMSDVNWRRYEN